jgi:hypothetical protein
MTFHFPMPENLANARGHWTRRYKAKIVLWTRCDQLALARQLPSAPATPWEFARVDVAMVLWGVMDVDNSMPRCKSLVDWLVTRGYLLSDHPRNLQWGSVPFQRIDRAVDPVVHLTLTRLVALGPSERPTRKRKGSA